MLAAPAGGFCTFVVSPSFPGRCPFQNAGSSKMAGSKFQYDESGGTFFYFLLSFLALVLIPASYYLWPKKDEKDDKQNASKNCQCESCVVKRGRLASKEPGKTTKQWIIKCCIVLGWVVFLAVAYKVAHLERDYVDWDPFEILQIDRAASQAEIKRAYRKLSLVYHPDKDTGDAKKFLQLTKAHAALTDEEAKKNWEMYGNPDGPGAMSFGIALPSWIVEKENSIWVLGLYALVFMVALPVAVGIWWYRSIKFGGDQILLGTTKLYYYFINKSHSMNLKRVLMVLAGSFEFQKGQNNEIIERPSDNLEVPVIMKEFVGFGEKNKEAPLCYSYSLKARALLYAHLSRLTLPPLTLDIDRLYIVNKCPYLIQEFVQCISQMTMMAYSGHVSQMPTLETLEICMKLSPLIIQALWDKLSPILQLPHIKEDMLRHFVTKTRNIRSVRSLMELSGKERRALLRTLTDSDYEDVMKVASQMPHVDISVDTEVLDDEKWTTITVGSIVTVTISLVRENMGEVFRYNEEEDELVSTTKEEDEGTPQEGEPSASANTKKPPVWKKKKGKTTKPKKKGAGKQHNFVKRNTPAEAKNSVEEVGKEKSKSKRPKEDADDSTSNSDSGRENDDNSDVEKDEKETKESKAQAEEDDQEWNKIQAKLGNKDKVMESRSLLSHDVHCPYFPDEKQEYWWLYIIDRKNKVLMTMPNHITDLVDTREISLKFTAPEKVGSYAYQVCLRSDSYLDADAVESFKIDVQISEEPAEEVKYGVTDDEKEDNDEASTDQVTDDDLDDEDSDDD